MDLSVFNEIQRELAEFNNGEPVIIVPCLEDKKGLVYGVTVYVRTIVSPKPDYVLSTRFVMTIPNDYPLQPPIIKTMSSALFHPNFSADGTWMSNWKLSNESISEYVMRLVYILQYKNIDKSCFSNRNATAWYNRMQGLGIFPTDGRSFVGPNKRINIIKINEERSSNA